MATAVIPLVEFRSQLEARSGEFAAALPSHIHPDHFQRAAVTAVQINPKLLQVERRSLFNSLMRCAQDGLIPDGREAALVIFRSKDRGDIAQYLPMIYGIRKLVIQSGEIAVFEQQVVCANDLFEFELGDEAHIKHKPRLDGPRGDPILVYSIAQFRSGYRSREVMTVEEIEKVRAVSRAAAGDAWVKWWSEMARKTVAKRHAKSLPMSNDVDQVLARDDKPDDRAIPAPAEPFRRIAMSEAFDRLAGPAPAEVPIGELEEDQDVATSPREAVTTSPRRRPGRPRKDAAPPPAEAADPEPPPHDGPWPDDAEAPADYDQSADAGADPDYQLGAADAAAGRKACLDASIRRDERRFAAWRAGFYSVTGENLI